MSQRGEPDTSALSIHAALRQQFNRDMNTLPPFFDTHAHLTAPGFAADIEQVVQRAAAAGEL